MNKDEIIKAIKDRIESIRDRSEAVNLSLESPLIGEGALLDSMGLVELCLFLEDLAINSNAEFNWTSESAMSRSRSMFRTIETLADEFFKQVIS